MGAKTREERHMLSSEGGRVPYVPPGFLPSSIGDKYRSKRNKNNKIARKARRVNR